MSKTRDTGFLGNVIKVDTSGNVSFVSGSTTLATLNTSGQLSGSSPVLSSSYALNADLLDGLDSTQFTLTSSFAAQTASFTAFTSSILSYTASQNILNGTYATTGSNTFAGIQTVNSNLVVTGSITAQTLIVSTINVTQSFSSGSNIFGNSLANTHVFSGSVTMNPGGLFVSSSGLVGIGNVVPAYTLDVSGTGRFTSTLLVSGAATFGSTINMTGTNAQILQTTSNSVAGNYVGTFYNSNANSYGLYIAGGNSSSNNALYITDSTRTNTLFTVLGDGKVGIGNLAPSYTLDVSGTGRFTSTLLVSGAATFSSSVTAGGKIFTSASVADNIIEVINSDTTNGYGLYVRAGGTATNRYVARFKNAADSDVMWVGNTGNVGIGTSSPSDKLQVLGSIRWGSATNYLVSSTDGGGVYMELAGTTTATRVLRIQGINNAANSYSSIRLEAGISEIAFTTIDLERMRITSAGTVQITNAGSLVNSVQIYPTANAATSGTTAVVQLNQSFGIGMDTISSVEYGTLGGNSAMNGILFRTYSGSYGYRFYFYSNGTAYNSTGTWGNNSDIKLKQDIVDASSQWDDIKALKFKKYKLKKDVQAELESTDGYVAPTHFGLIAQEVELTSPGLVEDVADEEGTTKMLKTSIMLMKSVKALQEAMQRIETLETENDTLKEILQRNNIQ